MSGINILNKLDKEIRAQEEVKPSESLATRFSVSESLSFEDLDQVGKIRIVVFFLSLLFVFYSEPILKKFFEDEVLSFRQKIQEVDSRISEARAKQESLLNLQREAEAFDAEIGSLKSKLAVVERIGFHRNYLVRAIDFIVVKMPPTIWMAEMEISLPEQKVKLKARSLSLQEVGDYLEALQVGAFFENWKLLKTQRVSSSSEEVSAREVKEFEMEGQVLLP